MDMLGFYVRHSYDPRFFSGDVTDTGTIRTRTAVYAPAGAEERLTRAYHTDPGKAPSADGAKTPTSPARSSSSTSTTDRSGRSGR